MEQTRTAETPQILAVDDVHLSAGRQDAEALRTFYGELLDLAEVTAEASPETLVFRGYRKAGPRLVIALTADPPTVERTRRQALIQVASLTTCVLRFADQEIPFQRLRGLTFHDDRLLVHDPAKNLIEVVCYHRF